MSRPSRAMVEAANFAAVDELFAALDSVLLAHRSLPDGEREDRLSDDAAPITGEIARRLAVARARISTTPVALDRAL